MPTYCNVSVGEGSSLVCNKSLSDFHLPPHTSYYHSGDNVAGDGAGNRSTSNYTSLALLGAIQAGDKELAQKLVKGGADPNQMDCHGPALPQAIRARFPEVAELLLEKGANPNAEDDEGPALMQAMRARFPKVAELLLEKGANPNAEDDEGPALMQAMRARFPKVAELLLEKGSSIS